MHSPIKRQRCRHSYTNSRARRRDLRGTASLEAWEIENAATLAAGSSLRMPEKLCRLAPTDEITDGRPLHLPVVTEKASRRELGKGRASGTSRGIAGPPREAPPRHCSRGRCSDARSRTLEESTRPGDPITNHWSASGHKATRTAGTKRARSAQWAV